MRTCAYLDSSTDSKTQNEQLRGWKKEEQNVLSTRPLPLLRGIAACIALILLMADGIFHHSVLLQPNSIITISVATALSRISRSP